MSHFIFMLTHHDRTVPDAMAMYQSIRNTPIKLVGFKDVGLPMDDLRRLTRAIRDDGRTALLEVVSESREAELTSVRAAVDLGVHCLLGGRHAAEAVALLRGSGILYFPFAGRTTGHPTRLEGTIDEIVADAKVLASLPGVDGLDLLAYRSTNDAADLTARVARAVKLPVIAAGSIDRPHRIDAMRDAGAWAFTVGSALFEGAFADRTLPPQINAILELEGVSA